MLNTKQTEEIEPRFRVMQIITAFLAAGPLFGAIVFFFLREPPKFTQQLGLIEWLGIGAAGLCYFGSFLSPFFTRPGAIKTVADAFDKKDRKQLSSGLLEKLTGSYNGVLVVRNALIENGIVTNLLFWFLGGSIYLIPGILIGLFLLAFNFPILDRYVAGIEDMFEAVKDRD